MSTRRTYSILASADCHIYIVTPRVLAFLGIILSSSQLDHYFPKVQWSHKGKLLNPLTPMLHTAEINR